MGPDPKMKPTPDNGKTKPKPKHKSKPHPIHDDDDYNITDDNNDGDNYDFGESADFEFQSSSNDSTDDYYTHASFIASISAVGLVAVVGVLYGFMRYRNSHFDFEPIPVESTRGAPV